MALLGCWAYVGSPINSKLSYSLMHSFSKVVSESLDLYVFLTFDILAVMLTVF